MTTHAQDACGACLPDEEAALPPPSANGPRAAAGLSEVVMEDCDAMSPLDAFRATFCSGKKRRFAKGLSQIKGTMDFRVRRRIDAHLGAAHTTDRAERGQEVEAVTIAVDGRSRKVEVTSSWRERSGRADL